MVVSLSLSLLYNRATGTDAADRDEGRGEHGHSSRQQQQQGRHNAVGAPEGARSRGVFPKSPSLTAAAAQCWLREGLLHVAGAVLITDMVMGG